jgi:phenylacetate-CoA ligase
MTPEDLKRLQSERFEAAVERACRRSWQRERCEAAGVDPARIRGLEDLARLPFTTKADFRAQGLGMLAVPREQVARFHASSGTTGQPTIVAYTRADLDVWSELVARCLSAAGARPGEVLHNAYGYGLFTGGLGLHAGAERLGLSVLPASGGQTERQAQLITLLKPRILTCTPSYMLTLAEAMERMGLSPRESSVEIGLHGAEPWSEAMRGEIERRWGSVALDIYGLSEVMGPGVAMETPQSKGWLTLWEDHVYPEIVDPESGEPLEEGEVGELVLTTLTRGAMPVIRYRTGDLTRLAPPAEGSPFRRIGRMLGRVDDMLIVRGVNLFPAQIEELVLETQGLAVHYLIELRRQGALDQMTVTVEAEVTAVATSADPASRLAVRIKDRLGVSVEVVLAPPGSLPRSEGKAKRVIDHRKPV